MNYMKRDCEMNVHNKDRIKSEHINFRVSPEERALIEARIKVTGLSKSEYYLKTFMEQKIFITVGKYQSDRLSLEFKRLREMLEKLDMSDESELNSVLVECRALLIELKSAIEDVKPMELLISDFEEK